MQRNIDRFLKSNNSKKRASEDYLVSDTPPITSKENIKSQLFNSRILTQQNQTATQPVTMNIPNNNATNPFARAKIARPAIHTASAPHAAAHHAQPPPARNIHEEMVREYREAEAAGQRLREQRKAERARAKAAAAEDHQRRAAELHAKNIERKERQAMMERLWARDLAQRAEAQAKREKHAERGADDTQYPFFIQNNNWGYRAIDYNDDDDHWGSGNNNYSDFFDGYCGNRPKSERYRWQAREEEEEAHAYSGSGSSDPDDRYDEDTEGQGTEEEKEEEEDYDDGFWRGGYSETFFDDQFAGSFRYNSTYYNQFTGQANTSGRQQEQQQPGFRYGPQAIQAAITALHTARNEASSTAVINEAELEAKISAAVSSVAQVSCSDITQFASHLKVKYKTDANSLRKTRKSAWASILKTFHPDKLQNASLSEQLVGLHVTRAITDSNSNHKWNM